MYVAEQIDGQSTVRLQHAAQAPQEWFAKGTPR
jgi:hypothetical protein